VGGDALRPDGAVPVKPGPLRALRRRATRRQLARRLRRNRVPWTLWRLYARDLPLLQGLSASERRRLRQLCGLFLAQKRLRGAHGLRVDDRMRLTIAAAACVPILAFGLDAYAGWHELIVYPDTFIVEREEIDEAGVVHRSRQALAGESADRGAMVLSWGDISRDAARRGLDTALIVHECAHKLDALDGVSDGLPPLPREMSVTAWRAVFSEAWLRLQQMLEAGADTVLDPYAAHSPAEFLAVATEQFFCDPVPLRAAEPDLYEQLRRFFRQDPAARQQRLQG